MKRIERASRSRGGLYLPETATEKPSEGVVIATGQGRLGEDGEITALAVKEGDRVLFGKYAGTEIKINGEDVLFLKENEIFGIFEA